MRTFVVMPKEVMAIDRTWPWSSPRPLTRRIRPAMTPLRRRVAEPLRSERQALSARRFAAVCARRLVLAPKLRSSLGLPT